MPSLNYFAQQHGSSSSGLASISGFHKREHFQGVLRIDRSHAGLKKLDDLAAYNEKHGKGTAGANPPDVRVQQQDKVIGR